MTDTQGMVIEGYRIEGVLGKGAMGIVYKGWDEDLQQHVAIKMIHDHLATSPNLGERLRQEARAMARLRHPVFVQAKRIVRSEGRIGFVMDYIDGVNLGQYMASKGGKLPPGITLHIMKSLLKGFQAAHTERLIHRDIKPSNIMIRETRNAQGHLLFDAKVMDFGIAKDLRNEEDGGMTRVDAVMYTRGYSSPEQLNTPKEVDHRADIFSLGMTYYEMLTGRLPFVGETDASVNAQIISDEAPLATKFNPKIKRCVADVIAKAIATNPDQRWQTCEEFLSALEKCHQDDDEGTGDPGGWWKVFLIVFAVLAILFGALWGFKYLPEPSNGCDSTSVPIPPDTTVYDWSRRGTLHVYINKPGTVHLRPNVLGDGNSELKGGSVKRQGSWVFFHIPARSYELEVRDGDIIVKQVGVSVAAGENETFTMVQIDG